MIYAALCILIMLAWTLIGPPIKINASTRGANHNGFSVKMPVPEGFHQNWGAVRAQEVAEWRLAWLCGAALGTSVFAFVAAPYAYIVYFVASALGMTLTRKLTDGFDYMGHGIEIMVAEEEGDEDYRAQEIHRMIHNDGRKHMTPEEVQAKLDSWNWLAKIARRFLTY